jgi:hypothetical protein
MGSSQPSVYFILGTPGSGRREIVRDLVENGLAPGDPVLVLLSAGEAADPAEEKLALRAQTTVLRAKWTRTELPSVDLPASGVTFFFADAYADPITQLELLQPWLLANGAQLARIFTVVDCQFAEKHPILRAWYEACIHFSDVVFLTNRVGVANKWVSDFLRYFADECFPSLFIQVKKSGVENPALVLDPLPRRFSQYFDEAIDLTDVVIETDDEDEEDIEDEDDGLPAPEAYFELLRSGRRVKELPDIAKYVGKAAKSGG